MLILSKSETELKYAVGKKKLKIFLTPSITKKATDTGNEVSISAIVTDELVAELMDENPKYKELYNKMTKYFTINVKNDLCDICSTHYGTEMYITIYSDIDISFFEGVMSKFTEDEFSIGEW